MYLIWKIRKKRPKSFRFWNHLSSDSITKISFNQTNSIVKLIVIYNLSSLNPMKNPVSKLYKMLIQIFIRSHSSINISSTHSHIAIHWCTRDKHIWKNTSWITKKCFETERFLANRIIAVAGLAEKSRLVCNFGRQC